ncbi:hypothetical protein ABUE34_14260 (plasmid) [Kozakia baliensis]
MAARPDFDMLSFTGSTVVGRSCIHCICIKKLGGKNLSSFSPTVI